MSDEVRNDIAEEVETEEPTCVDIYEIADNQTFRAIDPDNGINDEQDEEQVTYIRSS